MTTLFNTKHEYIEYFQHVLNQEEIERQVLVDFLNQQIEHLDQLTLKISHENFWHVFPELLGIDAKLTLRVELMQFDDFSDAEIIRMI